MKIVADHRPSALDLKGYRSQAPRMYAPRQFVGSEEQGWQLLDEEAFGLFQIGGEVAPLPFLIAPEARTIRAHVARANPIARSDGARASLLVLGPHGYVSARWYPVPSQHVPTWNYAFVRAQGTLRTLDLAGTEAVVRDLCRRFEPPGGYEPGELDNTFFQQLLGAIVGIELAVETLEVKLKLSQNRPADERDHVERAIGPSRLLEWMKSVRNAH